MQIPWAFSATSIPYNVSGVGYGLKLTGPILADIYLGNIKKWNNGRDQGDQPWGQSAERRHRADLPQRR